MKASYANLFIDLGKYTLATVVVVTGCIATAAIASSQNFKALGDEAFAAKSTQLAIKSPAVNVCPAEAKMSGWILTNKPGKVSYMIAKKGGGVSGPFTIEAVKSVNGGMASFSSKINIHQPVDTQYRILVAGTNGKVMSNWVPLKASCKLMLGG